MRTRRFWGYLMCQKVIAWHFESVFLEFNHTNLYCMLFVSICVNKSTYCACFFLLLCILPCGNGDSHYFNNHIFVVSADQVVSESNIPLSPQWLYAKPVDAKAITTGILGVQKFALVLSCCVFFPFVE